MRISKKVVAQLRNRAERNQVSGTLTRDKVVSVVRGRDLVGVYWKGTSGSKILFETSPKQADAIINAFNGGADFQSDEEKFQAKLAKAKVCSICFRKYKEWGNNASPINTGTCCNSCNAGAVIPARINSMRTRKLIK